MTEIVTLTMNPALDIATATEIIEPARKLRCDAPRYDPGGGGINVARAAHRLGGTSLAVFPAGGASGQMIENLLSADGVPHVALPVPGITRESLAVVERRTGKQYRFLLPGPELRAPDQERLLDTLAARMTPQTKFIVASGSLPPGVLPDFYRQVARLARDRGASFALDSSGEALIGAGTGIFMIKASLRELGHLRGMSVTGDAAMEEAARAVIAEGRCEILVVSLGADGALLVTKDACRRFPAAQVAGVGSVGAGDSMLAGMLVALARGWELAEAVRFGIAAGSAALLRPGTELCCREDAELLYRELGPA
jgi:6-phosphofructokinase 2